MPEDTVADKEFMGQICAFAARKAQNGVYMAQMRSKSLSAPVLLIVALGEQALALEQIIMSARQSDDIIEKARTIAPGWENIKKDG